VASPAGRLGILDNRCIRTDEGYIRLCHWFINWAVAKELATGLEYVVFSFHLLAVLSVYTYVFMEWQYEVVHVFEGGGI